MAAKCYTFQNGDGDSSTAAISPFTGSASDSTTWISKAKGLPLHSDIDMEGGKSHISTRYEYGNVKPPM